LQQAKPYETVGVARKSIMTMRPSETAMSLRLRLIGAITVILLASLTLGGLITTWHARQSVGSELEAAMVAGKVALQRAILAAVRSPRPEQYLTEIVSLFDGDRRLVVTLRNRRDETVVGSRLARSAAAAPAWFARLVAGPLQPQRMELPLPLTAFGNFLLAADPSYDAARAWRDMLTNLAVLAVFFGLVLGLVSLTLGWSLKPLHGLLEAFERIGKGDYTVRVSETGPAEFARVSSGLNAMARRLEEMEQRTSRLRGQLQTIQDEERAGLARDLHDEVSPSLFAVDVDASRIKEMAAMPASPQALKEIVGRAEAIRGAAEHMKKHVKEILGQLRPANVVQLGLESALQDLVQGMRRRHPDVAFEVAIDGSTFGSDLDNVIYRIIREGVSNALRHGRPSRIEIAVAETEAGEVAVQVGDNGHGLDPKTRSFGGFGIIGMRERLAALGGGLKLEDGGPAGGFVLKATIPLTGMHEPRSSEMKGAAE
jgi:two-component system sensor histidine kinase UhpB